MTPTLRRAIRIAEFLVVAILATIALFTYRELETLRKVPVALPSYQFDVTGEGENAAIETRGTWMAQQGPSGPLQTTTIECRKSAMKCEESAAVLAFLEGTALMESAHTSFDVERWDDKEVLTRAVSGPCADRLLVLDLREKRASARMSASHGGGKCVEGPERVLDLVAGYRVRIDALRSAKPF